MLSKQEGERRTPNPETLRVLKDSIFEAWRQLSPEHQATVALALVNELQQGEWGEWLRESIELQWSGDTEDFPFLAAAPPALIEPAQLPTALEGENPADFDRWMSLVDEAVWQMAGCSAYDLPDHDYRSMFEDGVTPTEAADEVLIEAGFSRFE